MLSRTRHGHTPLLYTVGHGLKPHKPYVAIGHLYTHLQSTSHLAHAASHCNCEIHNTQYHKVCEHWSEHITACVQLTLGENTAMCCAAVAGEAVAFRMGLRLHATCVPVIRSVIIALFS